MNSKLKFAETADELAIELLMWIAQQSDPGEGKKLLKIALLKLGYNIEEIEDDGTGTCERMVGQSTN